MISELINVFISIFTQMFKDDGQNICLEVTLLQIEGTYENLKEN